MFKQQTKFKIFV